MQQAARQMRVQYCSAPDSWESVWDGRSVRDVRCHPALRFARRCFESNGSLVDVSMSRVVFAVTIQF